ncbi:MAG: DUF2878 domain-containing protein [Halofilum sp. (in: g-proteobacteria)]|nr:DUF2878 domain-containing protein [Halofilum sp. (in: g-proteobacteria)]
MSVGVRPPAGLMAWNLVSLNVGWFACVLAAANGRPALGLPVVAVLLAIHLTLMPARRREALLIAALAGFGYVADSIPVLLGLFAFPEAARLGGPSPIWMVALWCNFATAPSVALYWLAGRPLLAAALGAVGGPLAYFGGLQLGAMLVPAGTGAMLAAVAVEWAIATPLVMWAAVRLGRVSGQPAPMEALAWRP